MRLDHTQVTWGVSCARVKYFIFLRILFCARTRIAVVRQSNLYWLDFNSINYTSFHNLPFVLRVHLIVSLVFIYHAQSF